MLVRRCYSYRRKSKAFARRRRKQREKEGLIQENIEDQRLPGNSAREDSTGIRNDMASGRKIMNDKQKEGFQGNPSLSLSIKTTTLLPQSDQEETKGEESTPVARANGG